MGDAGQGRWIAMYSSRPDGDRQTLLQSYSTASRDSDGTPVLDSPMWGRTATDVEPPVVRVGELEGGVDALTDHGLEVAVLLAAALAVPAGEGVHAAQRRLHLFGASAIGGGAGLASLQAATPP